MFPPWMLPHGPVDPSPAILAPSPDSRLPPQCHTEPLRCKRCRTRSDVLLESYEIRAGSGGRGEHRGGNGGTRRIRFLEPMTVSILSNNRRIAPFGMAGGEPGRMSS